MIVMVTLTFPTTAGAGAAGTAAGAKVGRPVAWFCATLALGAAESPASPMVVKRTTKSATVARLPYVLPKPRRIGTVTTYNT